MWCFEENAKDVMDRLGYGRDGYFTRKDKLKTTIMELYSIQNIKDTRIRKMKELTKMSDFKSSLPQVNILCGLCPFAY